MSKLLTNDEWESRFTALEAELDRVTVERDLYKQSTDAEISEMVSGPRGESIISILDSLERECGVVS